MVVAGVTLKKRQKYKILFLASRYASLLWTTSNTGRKMQQKSFFTATHSKHGLRTQKLVGDISIQDSVVVVASDIGRSKTGDGLA